MEMQFNREGGCVAEGCARHSPSEQRLCLGCQLYDNDDTVGSGSGQSAGAAEMAAGEELKTNVGESRGTGRGRRKKA